MKLLLVPFAAITLVLSLLVNAALATDPDTTPISEQISAARPVSGELGGSPQSN